MVNLSEALKDVGGRDMACEMVAMFMERQMKQLDALTKQYTAFESFKDMTENTHASYTPSMKCVVQNMRSAIAVQDATNMTRLADAYDDAMITMGDCRRAYRY